MTAAKPDHAHYIDGLVMGLRIAADVIHAASGDAAAIKEAANGLNQTIAAMRHDDARLSDPDGLLA